MKMSANKKKIIVVISMVLLLIGTGCLNYFLTTNSLPDEDGKQTSGDDAQVTLNFFEAYREDRQATRAETIMYLDQIIASEVSTEDAVVNAQDERISVVSAMEKELVLEGLIKASGFDDCVVTMSTENINVVVKTENLAEEDMIRVLDIVVTETAADPSKVIIIPYV